MKQITFYLDFISPYAYLAFERLPVALQGQSYHVVYKPVLFAGLLKHHGQLGPAEFPGKREWTYRQVLWLAREHGIALQMPAAHPFNPLQLLRLAADCGDQGLPNRWVCETVFRHVWRGGADALAADRLDLLEKTLAPQRRHDADAAKQALRQHTDAAIARGVFGVPTFEVDGHLLWGLDALPMVAAVLGGDPWVGGEEWCTAASVPLGVSRSR